MKVIVKRCILPFLLAASGLAVAAGEHEVGQLNKEFTVDKVEAQVGDTVVFTNQDPFFHNIFSLSDTQMFDLGSWPTGETRSVKLTNPGVVLVECAIHPGMSMEIHVSE